MTSSVPVFEAAIRVTSSDRGLGLRLKLYADSVTTYAAIVANVNKPYL